MSGSCTTSTRTAPSRTTSSQENPEKLKNLIEQWFNEAGKYQVLPLDDRHPAEILTRSAARGGAAAGHLHLLPGRGRRAGGGGGKHPWPLLQDPGQRRDREARRRGHHHRHGSRFGGYALFVKDKKLWYVYNFLGIPPEQQFVSKEIKPGKYTLGMEFTKESTGQYGESHGTTKLYVNDEVVAEGPMRTQTGNFSLGGDGLCVGRDSADPVSKEYSPGFPFTGGTIQGVAVTVADDVYINLEKEAAAMMARD